MPASHLLQCEPRHRKNANLKASGLSLLLNYSYRALREPLDRVSLAAAYDVARNA